MAHLILVKHSMPDIDPTVPAHLWQLSSSGRSRCDWLARELTKFQPECLFSSVEPKAKETAELIGSSLGLVARTVDGLHENDRTGFSYINDTEAFEQRFRGFFCNPDDRLIGNETANEALGRFHNAIERAVKENSRRTVCVVAHGTVISLFVANHNNVPAFQIWSALNPLPAYIVVSTPDYEIVSSAAGYDGSQ